MSGTPNTVNPLATWINSILKDGIEGVAPDLVYAATVADWPPLGWPVIGTIWKAILNYLAGKFYGVVAQGSTTTVIAGQIDIEKQRVTDAIRALDQANDGGDPNEISSALAAAKDAADNLFGYDGSATP